MPHMGDAQRSSLGHHGRAKKRGDRLSEAVRKRRIGQMPMFMDHHRHVEGLSAEAVGDAHRKDEEIQGE